MPLPPPAGHHGTQEGSRGGPAQGSGGAGAPHHPLREAHPSQEGEDKVKIEFLLEAMNWRIREEHL